MRIERQYRSILNAVKLYEDLLKQVSEDQFCMNPPDGGWSYSETFSHIFQSNLASLIAVEKCILRTGIYNRDRINWKVWLILFFGRFPPGKIRAPERIASMVKKISREDAGNLIRKFKSRLDSVKPGIKNADPHQKIKHPRLGLLNANQWFRFIEIHTIHHTAQLRRIERMLKKT